MKNQPVAFSEHALLNAEKTPISQSIKFDSENQEDGFSTRPSERARRVPFLDFPPGLGGAMAMTDRDLREGDGSGDCFILGNWREKLEFEDKPLAGQDKKGVESFAFLFSEVKSKYGLRGAETEDAIADSSNGRTEAQEMFFRIKFLPNENPIQSSRS